MNLSKLLDFNREKIPAWKVKGLAQLTLGFSIVLFVYFLLVCFQGYYWGDKTLLLKVNVHFLHPNLYNSLSFNFGDFVTGTEGTLYYKATSLPDYFILQNIGGLNIVDYIFFLLIGFLIYKSFYKIQDGKPFSKKRSNTYTYLAIAIIFMSLIKNLFYLFVSMPFLLNRTNGKFQLAQQLTGGNNFVFATLVVLFIYFLQQGNKLQEEQELTI